MRFGARELIFLLLLLSLPVGAYFFVFEPRNAEISAAYREIKDKQAKLQQLEEATMNIDDLGAEIEKLRDAVDLFERKLPSDREVDVILKEIWELAARENLVPRSIRTDRPVRTAHYTELPIRMEIHGDFDGYYRFLLNVEKLSRVTRTPQLNLVKGGGRTEKGQMRAEMTLTIFFEGNPAGNNTPAATSGRGQL